MDCEGKCTDNCTSVNNCLADVTIDTKDIEITGDATDLSDIDTLIDVKIENGAVAFSLSSSPLGYLPDFSGYIIYNKEELSMTETHYIPPGEYKIKIKVLASNIYNNNKPVSKIKHVIKIGYKAIRGSTNISNININIKYNNCNSIKEYKKCVLPGCFYCYENDGYNVIDQFEDLNAVKGVCISGDKPICKNGISKSNNYYTIILSIILIIMINV